MIGKLLVRRATVVAQCRAEPQTKKKKQILSFAHCSRYVTVSGHAQDFPRGVGSEYKKPHTKKIGIQGQNRKNHWSENC